MVQPALVFVDTAKFSAISERGIEGPPTLVVEVLSPSTMSVDRKTKLQLYARYGVPYYWIIDPEAQAVEAYVLIEGSFHLERHAAGIESVTLPPFMDLEFRLASLWA